MECNKDEAVRARAIAEQKLQNCDFEGAKKFALKAEKLFPELENMSQLLTVCNVHCCAKTKIYGSEMDWYGVLQIEPSADEISIKKQYRKLALLLHPDKNKFSGAEAAFKLIGEANRILTDKTRRSEYDKKYRFLVKTAPKPTTHQPNRASSMTRQHGSTNKYQNGSSNFTASYSHQQAPHSTFWTLCSACGVKYQYYREFVNRILRCQTCGTSFIAHDLGPLSMSPGYPWSQFANQKEVPSNSSCKVPLQCNGRKWSGMHVPHEFAGSDPIPKAGSSVQVGGFKKQEEGSMHKPQEGLTAQQRVDGCSTVKDRQRGVEKQKPNVAKPEQSRTSRNVKKKRERKSSEESDESFEIGSGAKVEDKGSQKSCGNNTGVNSKVNRVHQSRKSSRHKHVSYDEKLNDDDFACPPKRSKVNESHNANEENVDDSLSKKNDSVDVTAAANICLKEVKQKASALPEATTPSKSRKIGEPKGKEKEPVILDNKNEVPQVDTTSGSSADLDPSPQVLECPDPEFSDFEKNRAENCFAVNQVWAIYDTLDGMPRFYARVKKVLTPGFKLQITWLEPKPDEELENNWAELEMPISCGKYCNGSSQGCEDRLMFSHRIDPIKSFGKRIFLVHPRKGETWALFKGWDLKWFSEPEKHKPPYQYDFVEVLTDFDEENGIGVAHLGKVKGFVSIFQRTARGQVISFTVSPQELYRFSHQVPSCRMTGKEREGVPMGSFELDPAALPTDLDQLVDPSDLKVCNHNLNNNEANCSCPKFIQNQAKATIDPKENLTSMKNDKSDNGKMASIFRRSTSGSTQAKAKSDSEQNLTPIKNEKSDIGEVASALKRSTRGTGQAKATIDSEENLTPVKNDKGNNETETSPLRRSTRVSSHKLKDPGPVDAGQSKEDDSIKGRPDSSFTQPKTNAPSGDAGNQRTNTPKRHEKNDPTTDGLKPRRSPRDLSKKRVSST